MNPVMDSAVDPVIDPVVGSVIEESRRFQYLKALGVTQYRRRSLTVIESVSAPITADQHVIMDSPNQLAVADNNGSEATADVRGNIAEVLRAAPTELPADIGQQAVTASHDQQRVESPSDSFELLVWRSAQILVLDFSNSESAMAQAKHRLANNIMKALWPLEFVGAGLHQHVWPMSGVDASGDSAREWLGSLVAGHLQHEETMPIWVMGEPGLKMLFPDQTDFSDLEGTRVRHEQLSVELLVSPSLSQILESAVAKAQTWQLLKSLR